MIICRLTCRLNNEHVLSANIFNYFDKDLSVGKTTDVNLSNWKANMFSNRRGQFRQ